VFPVDNTSGFRGVYYHRKTNKWVARINFDGTQRHLGIFDNILDAALAVTHAQREIGGYPGDLDSRIETLVSTKDCISYRPDPSDPILFVPPYEKMKGLVERLGI